MIRNEDFNAEAYDAVCRIPSCDFSVENANPTLVAMQLYPHIGDHAPIGAPSFALRIAEGYEGLDPDNPVRTSADGWNRDPSPDREQIDEWVAESKEGAR